MTEKFYLKIDPEDIEDRERSGMSNGSEIIGKGPNACTEACPYRRTVVHFHCQWVRNTVAILKENVVSILSKCSCNAWCVSGLIAFTCAAATMTAIHHSKS